MSLPLALLLLALALGSAEAARRLRDSAWTSRYPAAGLAVWHGTAVTFVGACLAASALLAHDVFEHTLILVTGADKPSLHVAYAGPRIVDGWWNAAALLIAAMAALAAHALASAYLDAVRTRKHVARLLAERPTIKQESVHIVDDGEMFAFSAASGSVWRRHTRTIISSAVVAKLTPEQVSAVVAHERAHGTRRHHLSVAFADVVFGAVRWAGVLRTYPGAVRMLVEMQADDDAARETSHESVARALLAMAESRRVGLAMASSPTATRVRRQLSPGPVDPARDADVRRLAVTAALTVSLIPPTLAALPLIMLL
jgi:Zn-dependent protease with chaperone function